MEILFVMIGFSLVIALVFLVAFFWAVKDGQYEDSYSPSIRILFDDASTPTTTNNNKQSHKTE